MCILKQSILDNLLYQSYIKLHNVNQQVDDILWGSEYLTIRAQILLT